MTTTARILFVSILATLPPAVSAAGKYTWFDGDPTESGMLSNPSRFGTDVYRSLEEPTKQRPAVDSSHAVSLYGDYAPNSFGADALSRRFINFGVRWRHRVSEQDQLSVSAEQGEGAFAPSSTYLASSETLDTRAAVSWRRDLDWGLSPSITGGVFLGEEAARDEAARGVGRRYAGITVGGELRLRQAHTPYLSLRMQRSYYDLPESSSGAVGMAGSSDGAALPPLRTTDDFSRFSAGWRWQVQRGWSVQAEASYGFDMTRKSDLLGLEREGSSVFFGTRFDFR